MLLALTLAAAFVPMHLPAAQRSLHSAASALRCCEPATPSPDETKVGSKAYYEGFLTSPLDESVTVERGDGTEQAIKLAGGALAGTAFLFLGFMASNGLLPHI